MAAARVALLALSVAACGGANDATPTTFPSLPGLPTQAEVTEAVPPLDATRVLEGQTLYEVHCALCHGSDLAGAPDWQVPNADGSFPPPPQDATGHTWHHPDQLLLDIVLAGSDFPESRMPAFGEVLSEEDVVAILDYIKSSWGPEERLFQWEQTVRAAG